MTTEADLRTRVSRLRSRLLARRRERAGIERLRDARPPRVLVVDLAVPAHDRNSGGLRMTWLLRLMRTLGCHVTLFPTQQREAREPYTSELTRLGVEVELGPHSYAEFADSRAGLYDLVFLSTPDAAGVAIDASRRAFPAASIVYDSLDLHHLRVSRKVGVVGGPAHAEYWREKEVDCIRRSDLVATVTENEAGLVRSLVPSATTVVLPNVHEAGHGRHPPHEATRDLLFIGGFLHDPNLDAVGYFVGEILPLVRAEIDVRLWVIGPDPPEEIRALASGRVIVTGHLPEVDDHFRQARVFVSPLRYGAGMKGKIGHAMALGLPVVTTTIGAEGMSLVDGEDAVIRDGAEAFAAGVVSLYRDAVLWQRLSTRSQEIVRERWSPDAMRGRLDELLSATVRAPRP